VTPSVTSSETTATLPPSWCDSLGSVHQTPTNTRVEFDADTNESKVYLHGNHIADVGDDYIRLFDGGWQSNTTKSRLNAILSEHGIAGEGVFQKDFNWFIRLYNGTEFFTTEFRNGMKLGALATTDLLV
jgi:hypothetical protein